MKAISATLQLTGCSTRVDGSLSLRFSSPELTCDEKAAFMELQNLNLKVLIQPMDDRELEVKDVKREFECKTPSQRLRAVLFVAWKQASEPGEFEDFYRHKMEKYIEEVKQQLQPV